MDCIFCSILDKKVPAKTIHEDEQVIAFDDIHPKAPIHKLIIPRKHIATLNDMTQEDISLVGHMMYTAQSIAKKLNIAEHGYRVIMNCNQGGGQLVYHIHLHLLAGRDMQWPPG